MITIGSLGRLHFRAGNYVYVGSAMAGLEARVARHLGRKKKLHWHIDYLLTVAQRDGAVLFPSREREECALSRTLHELSETTAVGRFGATDCGCPAHLFFLGKRPFGPLLLHIDGLGPLKRTPPSGGR